MNDSEKILNSINNIKSQIEDTKAKLDTSKRVSILSLVASILLFVSAIVLISIYFSITVKSRIMMIMFIVLLTFGFVALQIFIVNKLLVKYVYVQKLNTLIKASELIKKEINK